MNDTRIFNGVLILSTVLLISLLGVLTYMAVESANREQQLWNDFAYEHNCIPVAKSQDVVIPMTMINPATGIPSTTMMIIPGTTTYRCDDGVEYKRAGNARNYTK
jgi:hypothetical protein